MTSRSSAQARQLPGSESKNGQDVSVGSKPGKSSGGGSSSFSRGSRRREPAQGSLSGLNPSKPGPKTRNTGAGKRPNPRGGFNNRNLDKQTLPAHQVDQADEWELGSLYNSGGKKPNYNHLLNFQYSQRGGAQARGDRRGQPMAQGYRKKKREEELRPRYDHTHYLQANCQFVVRAGQDYSVQAADPDVIVDWSLIEQVNLKVASDDATACPICLYPPTAGKMSECGHVFCWTCILHYLALSDDKWRPCPICLQDITKDGLKSVKILSQHNFSTGECIKMTLMKRERNSLFAVPVSQDFIKDNPTIINADVDKSFVKLLTANPEQVKTEILDKERMELEKQWEEEKTYPEACFVQEALKLLDERQVETMMRPKVKQIKTHSTTEPTMPGFQSLAISSPTSPDNYVDPFAEEIEIREITEAELKGDLKEETAEDSSDRPRHISGVSQVSSDSVSSGSGEEVISEEGVTVTDLDISILQTEPTVGQPRQVFYFYQSSDGQPIYLHALNVQMLVKEFGALDNCPPVIQAEILEKEGAVMSEHLRDRLRYLKHLPVSTNFEVAELNLSYLVSKETMNVFKDQVDTRKRKRNRKLRDEKRREKKIEHEEARRLGYPGSMKRVESEFFSKNKEESQAISGEQFPSMSGEETQTKESGAASVISFANITRAKPVSAPAPALPSGASWACLGSIKPLPARGLSLVSSLAQDSEPEENGEDYVPPPPAASLGDTLAAALLAGKANTMGKKAGKKGRGKTLLLTGGAPRPNL